MQIAIILFPGSNCLEETKRYFEKRNHKVSIIWHKEYDITKFHFDLLILPGGFAFGDRYYEKATNNYHYDPGAMALASPVIKIIKDAYKQKIPIWGICNGFQILLKLNLLPGTLNLNKNKLFTCKKVKCILDNKKEIILDIANKYGNYQIEEKYIKAENIFLKYAEEDNGSTQLIAGITNSEKTVFGMMPHPERNTDSECPVYNYLAKFIINKVSQDIDKLMESEHISYKSTKKFLKHLYTKGKHVIQGPGENAGLLDLGQGYCLALRIESHNHPISIDPYNGAATGVGGILRDIFTMGARPIAVCDFIRLGQDEKIRLHQVVSGISDYANCFGVANVGGNWLTSQEYQNNPLVNIACFGIVKKDKIVYGNALNEDDILIYVGSRTGSDGIAGAEMASQSFSKDTNFEALKKNIQIGDPYLEKLLLEACLEISEKNLAVGMQDMGAGGVLCSSIEVIARGREKTGLNLGGKIYLDKIPTKGKMDDYSKLASESQERMLIVARPENKEKIYKIFDKWDLEFCQVGTVNNSGWYEVITKKEATFYRKKMSDFSSYSQDWPLHLSEKKEIKRDILRDDIHTTYDSTIGGRTFFMERGELNYSIMDIHEINKKLIISWADNFDDCYKTITDLNYEPLGLVNCLNYGHPKEAMGDLALFLSELTHKCEQYQVPVVGGNVSLYNSTDDKSINASPILVMVGLSKDVTSITYL